MTSATYQRGIGLVPIIVVIALALGGILLYLQIKSTPQTTTTSPTPASSDGNQIMCTQDAKQCPDGSYVSRHGPQCQFDPCPGAQGQNSAPTNWQTYTSTLDGISFKFPSNASVKEEGNGVISVVQWGPSQKVDTEFYDGIAVTISRGDLTDKLQNFVYLQSQDTQNNGEVIQSPQPTKLNGLQGYVYRAQGVVGGQVTYMYLQLDQSHYLKVANATQDPQNQGFINTANQIIGSITLAQ